jgi:ureidoacrylate peracid hydrolase
MTGAPPDLGATAVLLIDLQRDFLAADGAYGRAGQTAEAIAALPGRLAPVLGAARAASVPVISAQFTLVPVRGRDPVISPHLRTRRPFLGRGDFEPGRPGHALVDELAPADVVVEKVAYSAFFQSRLEWVLRALDARTLLVAGIVTNGGVASTVRDAHVRDLRTLLLTDGCAAFDPDVHEATLRSLAGVVELVDCEEAQALLSPRSAGARRAARRSAPGAG